MRHLKNSTDFRVDTLTEGEVVIGTATYINNNKITTIYKTCFGAFRSFKKIFFKKT